MSRSARRILEINAAFSCAFIGAFIGAFASSGAAAQDAGSISAEQALENAEAAYGPPPPKPTCAPQEGDEIVVCAEEQDQSQFRVKSSNELDPTSEEAIDDGLPRAPDVGGPGIFKGPATAGGLCFIPPCPKEAALIIDVTALPEAPPGSDADRIARGLAPLGQDEAREGSVENPLTAPATDAATENVVQPITLPESSSPAAEQSTSPNLPAAQ